MPRTVWRVVWGRPEVIATFSPTSAFVRVDLPAFGRPTTHANPDRNPSGQPDAGTSPASASASAGSSLSSGNLMPTSSCLAIVLRDRRARDQQCRDATTASLDPLGDQMQPEHIRLRAGP